MSTPPPLERAIEDYLTYLRVERGLSPATIRAYRGDLADFAAGKEVAATWAEGPEPARRHLAARTRRGRPAEPGLAPTSLRRRAASIRGFYRFAFGDGLIERDVAAHLDLPRQPRLLPETLTVAEVDRNILKQLGINLNGGLSVGSFKGLISTDNPFGVTNKPPDSVGVVGSGSSAAGCGAFSGSSCSFADGIFGTIRALEQTAVIRTLAEPTLTAISGESASFLAGGEFPVPVGRDKDNNVIIEYKPFGVSLGFTPVVLSEGRISLRVKTEVSELSSEDSIQLSGITLPSISVRRSETTMELPSGGSMVMAGMIQDNIRQAISGFPGLAKLPVLGTLFRSRDFVRKETELVVIVTPYLVKPVPRDALARPDDGFAPAADNQGYFLGRINRVYGVEGKPAPAGSYRGTYGFILE